jgi:hypothetical protein
VLFLVRGLPEKFRCGVQVRQKKHGGILRVRMVRDRGFEPLTPSVSRKCSTTELTAQPAGTLRISLNPSVIAQIIMDDNDPRKSILEILVTRCGLLWLAKIGVHLTFSYLRRMLNYLRQQILSRFPRRGGFFVSAKFMI